MNTIRSMKGKNKERSKSQFHILNGFAITSFINLGNDRSNNIPGSDRIKRLDIVNHQYHFFLFIKSKRLGIRNNNPMGIPRIITKRRSAPTDM